MSKEKKLNFDWGTGLFIAIGLFVVTTLSVVAFIISLDFDLVSQDYYEKGVQYEQQIKNIEQANALEIPVTIQFTSEENVVEIIFPDQFNSQQLSGTIMLYRPSDSSLDRNYDLQLNGNYMQKIDASELARGKWLVKLSWENNDESYFKETSIFM